MNTATKAQLHNGPLDGLEIESTERPRLLYVPGPKSDLPPGVHEYARIEPGEDILHPVGDYVYLLSRPRRAK